MPTKAKLPLGIWRIDYVDDSKILELPGVQRVLHVSKPYKLVSRDFHPEDTISDGPQSLTFQGFKQLMVEVRRLNGFLGYA